MEKIPLESYDVYINGIPSTKIRLWTYLLKNIEFRQNPAGWIPPGDTPLVFQ